MNAKLNMTEVCRVVVAVAWLSFACLAEDTQVPGESIAPLLQVHCVHCHDGSDERVDLQSLSFDLSNEDPFRSWVRVWERISEGEMPPPSEPRPPAGELQAAISALESSLTDASRHRQERDGRVVLRRLTRSEYNYTLQDLLGITTDVTPLLPAEANAGFDTIAANQGFSALHVESFLNAADRALDEVIQLAAEPNLAVQHFEYREQEGVRRNLDKKEQGERGIVGELDDAIVMFSEASYIFKLHGFHVQQPGRYRIRAQAYGYQTERPVVLSLNAGNYKKGQQRLIDFFDLEPDRPTTVETVTTLNRGDYLFPAALDLRAQADGKSIWNIGPDDYQGSGVALKWIEVEGPLVDRWPPQSTRDFLSGVEVRKLERKQWRNNQHYEYEIVAGSEPREQLRSVLGPLVARAFRRPTTSDELEQFVSVGAAVLEDGRSLEEAIRVASRNVLTSPKLLFFHSKPGKLDDYALASRLSYFLWKSLPDAELMQLAQQGDLSEPATLRNQVERLLNDARSDRFINDFADQWLGLRDIDSTAPDERLYPEFDEMLKRSMVHESRAFVGELVRENLPAENLIDSDFAMLNRRLAEHYGVAGVFGQEIRPVALPKNSLRGGLMTQASVLKVTANGTVTSPVRRGSWVLTRLLGQPPDPPPPGVGSVEPDTRGTSTIRDLLKKHRDAPECASCHNDIDPPGFALESFDVIGGYRDEYRTLGEGKRPTVQLRGRNIWEYKLGLPVDASGTTSDSQAFAGIQEFKAILVKEREQVARNLVQQLIAYSTGAEMQFADQPVIESILDQCRGSNFGVRDLIQAVVQSSVFQNK